MKHPITNGVAEGLNSKIMSIKRKTGGFRNPSDFTTAIYFHCGELDLYPRQFRMVLKNRPPFALDQNGRRYKPALSAASREMLYEASSASSAPSISSFSHEYTHRRTTPGGIHFPERELCGP